MTNTNSLFTYSDSFVTMKKFTVRFQGAINSFPHNLTAATEVQPLVCAALTIAVSGRVPARHRHCNCTQARSRQASSHVRSCRKHSPGNQPISQMCLPMFVEPMVVFGSIHFCINCGIFLILIYGINHDSLGPQEESCPPPGGSNRTHTHRNWDAVTDIHGARRKAVWT